MKSISKPNKWEYTDLIKNNRSCKLLVAARAGRHKDIVQLIDDGADVNYRDPYNGRTCLINAAFGKMLKNSIWAYVFFYIMNLKYVDGMYPIL